MIGLTLVELTERIEALASEDGEYAIVFDLYRRQSAFLPSALRVVEREDCWRVTFVLATEMEPSRPASVPIRSEV